MIGPSPMKLRGRIRLEDNRMLTFIGEVNDGSSFNLQVDQFDIEMNEPFKPSQRLVNGWLYVQAEAQQGTTVYLTLPKPTITHGKQISVNELQLMPRYATLKDFGAKNSKDSKKMVEGSINVPAPKKVKAVKKEDPSKARTEGEFEEWLAGQTPNVDSQK